MSLWSRLTGFFASLFSGGGGIISAVDDGLKLADDVAKEIHDHNQRVAGADHVVAVENAQEAKAERNAAQALIDTTRDRALKQLRDGSA